jgi:DNA-binding XRE family transcriptional regulator
MTKGWRYPVIGIQQRKNGGLSPLVNGPGGQRRKLDAIAACLFDNLGRAVSYKQLLTVIGRKADNPTSRHLLRQYISTLREMRIENGSPYIIAVGQEVGYVLCEIAENAQRTLGTKGSDGIWQLPGKVRQLRIATGLTQTALAKRCGMNRSEVSRLEAGHRRPSLDTLARLAKALQVTPRSLL